MLIQSTQNLDLILSSARPGDAFQLVKGGQYKIQKPIIPLRGGWSLDGSLAQVDIGPLGTVFDIVQPGITVSNIVVKPTAENRNSVLCRVKAAGFCFTKNFIGDGLLQVGICNPGGTGAIFQGNTLGKTFSCTLYTEEDGTHWTHNSIAGSCGETPIRVDLRTGGVMAQRPKGTYIVGNTIRSLNNKGIGELRMSQETVVGSNDLYDYLRIGQDGIGLTEANQCDTDVQVRGNVWHPWPGLGTVNVCLMIKGGSTVVASDNEFPAVATSYFASVNLPSQAIFNNNVRRVPKGIVPRGEYLAGPPRPDAHDGFRTVFE